MKTEDLKKMKKNMQALKDVSRHEMMSHALKKNDLEASLAALKKYQAEYQHGCHIVDGVSCSGLEENASHFARRIGQGVAQLEKQKSLLESEYSRLTDEFNRASTRVNLLDRFLEKKKEEEGKGRIKKIQRHMEEQFLRKKNGEDSNVK